MLTFCACGENLDDLPYAIEDINQKAAISRPLTLE
jgi:hypothetical protein